MYHLRSNLLSNYATTDVLARGARAAIAVSLIAGYPLAFSSLRNALPARLTLTPPPPIKKLLPSLTLAPRAISLVLLTCITLAASVVRNLGFVSAFAGAILGSAIIYVL